MFLNTVNKNKTVKWVLSSLAISAMLVGCSTTKETTTKTDANPANAPMAKNAVVSSSDTTTLSDVKDAYAYDGMSESEVAEYLLFNVDVDSTTVTVKQAHPVAAIYFDFDEAKLDRANKVGVNRAYQWLENHPEQGLVIIGHADKRGSMPYNQQLALDRAQAAGNALMKKGISSDRLLIVSHGEQDAMFSNPKYNRRVIFKTDPTNAYGVNDEDSSDSNVIRIVTAARQDDGSDS